MEHQHYIVNKRDQHIEHGPFPSERAANVYAAHSNWYNPKLHEVGYGSPSMEDDADDQDQDQGATGDDSTGITDDATPPQSTSPDADTTPKLFVVGAVRDVPVGGPFETEEDARAFIKSSKAMRTRTTLHVVQGYITADDEFIESAVE